MFRKHLPSVALMLALAGCPAGQSPGGGSGNGDGGRTSTEDAGTPSNVDGGNSGEYCGNGLDDDGDDRVDEDCRCEPGTEQGCFAGEPDHAGVGACRMGLQRCNSDFEFGTWDVCLGQGHPSEETCDGIDNDCDGETDEGCECLTGEERSCYSGPAGTEGRGVCQAGAQRCVAEGDGSAWADCEGEVFPSDEVCDGRFDEDCDGRIDEGCDCTPGDSRDCYAGPAGTEGTGICAAGRQRCVGTGASAEWGSCDGATLPRGEVCSGGEDEDCDGLVDCADPDCEATCCMPWSESLPVIPVDGELLFVVDRSGSMDWPAASGATRWLELRNAVDSVLPMLSDLELGLATFPEMDGTAERNNCSVASGPDVPLGAGTGAAISARLVTVDPRGGDTPTPDAFAAVESYLRANPSSGHRFVVLATDGLPEPNCGATVPATVSAIADLESSLGVPTFVLGIVGPGPSGDMSGIPALRSALNEMAVAGGRPRAGAVRYYEAVDGRELTRTLETVLAAATDCEFELSSAPPRPASTVVRQDGAAVPPGGYTLVGRTLRFRGEYCERISEGLVSTVSAGDGC